MRTWQLCTLAIIAIGFAGSGATQSQLRRLELVKPDRCIAKRLVSEDQVRCFAWATTRKSGDIDGAQARCTNPEFVALAKNCLNDHRLKKEFRGAEEQVCVEFSYLFSEAGSRFGVTSRVLVNSTKELPDCELAVSPNPFP